jgi:hypothetical protein
VNPPLLQLLAFAFSGALAGWILIWLLRVRVATASMAHTRASWLGDELMVLAEWKILADRPPHRHLAQCGRRIAG